MGTSAGKHPLSSLPIGAIPVTGRRRGRANTALQLVRNRPAMVGLVCIAAFAAAALLAPVIAPYGPYSGTLAGGLQPPSWSHLMGTDVQGRDVFSRVLYGARVSLEIDLAAVAVALLMGGVIGAIAGGFGGWVDGLLMRVTDVFLALPGILLAIGIVSFLGRGIPQLILAIAVTYAPTFARLLRGSLLALRSRDFVVAGRTLGESQLQLLMRHMLPNALTPLIVQATLVLATAIIDISGLGFLGLGPPDPSTAEWGTMLADASPRMTTAPYLVFFPGAAIVISAIGFNLLGDGLREALDPRLRK
jgi:ABC-type dipeptide/oligopeptide/nickel transport system permease subunit